MKPILFAIPVITALLLPSLAFPDDKDKPAAKAADSDMAEAMKKMAEFATPGAGHKALEPLVGEWVVESKMWMGGQGSPMTESKGSASAKWILDGRYLQEEFQGEMMGMPFRGIGITAYDNFRKQYVNIWMDSLSTSIFKSEGSSDTEGKVFTYVGKMDEPMTGEKDKPTKAILRILSADKHVFEMHDLALGEKSKVLELTYTRKK